MVCSFAVGTAAIAGRTRSVRPWPSATLEAFVAKATLRRSITWLRLLPKRRRMAAAPLIAAAWIGQGRNICLDAPQQLGVQRRPVAKHEQQLSQTNSGASTRLCITRHTAISATPFRTRQSAINPARQPAESSGYVSLNCEYENQRQSLLTTGCSRGERVQTRVSALTISNLCVRGANSAACCSYASPAPTEC